MSHQFWKIRQNVRVIDQGCWHKAQQRLPAEGAAIVTSSKVGKGATGDSVPGDVPDQRPAQVTLVVTVLSISNCPKPWLNTL